jgi:hypothetical protein
VPVGGVSGIVVDTTTGEPVRGAHVKAYAVRTGRILPVSLNADLLGWAEADDGGRFTIESIEPGRYALGASADGYADSGVEEVQIVAEGEIPEVKIALERGIVLGARIVNELGQPVAQARAFLSDRHGEVVRAGGPPRSREDGRMEISIRQGTYRMTVVHAAYAPSRLTVEAAQGAEPTVILRRGGKMNVTVADPKGLPVEGATVEIVDEAGESVLEAMLFLALMNGGGVQPETKADGTLSLERVPAGALHIAASKDGARSREQRILVNAGHTTEVLLTLE